MANIAYLKYLILYNYDNYWYTDNAVSVKDCLLQFLSYTNNNTPLVQKALNGMETEHEMVELINTLTVEDIQFIYKIDRVIYKEKS